MQGAQHICEVAFEIIKETQDAVGRPRMSTLAVIDSIVAEQVTRRSVNDGAMSPSFLQRAWDAVLELKV